MKSIINQMLQFLISGFWAIHKGSIIVKIKSTFILGLSLSPVAYVVDKVCHWGMTNIDYIMLVLGAICVDHILGSIYHAFFKRDFVWKKNFTGLSIKVALVVLVAFIFEGLNHIVKSDSFLKEYLIIVTRLSVFLYPAGSALMNSAEITNGVFPPIGIINWMKKFNKTLETGSPNQKSNNNIAEEPMPAHHDIDVNDFADAADSGDGH